MTSLTVKDPEAEVAPEGLAAELTATRAALRTAEELTALLVETLPQGIVFQDADGRIVSVNPAAERILGKSRATLAGQTSRDLEGAAHRPDGSPFPGSEHPASVALRTGREVRGVIMGVFNPREGARRWIDVMAVPLFREGDSAPFRVYTSFEDVTERRRAEDALRQRVEEQGRLLEARERAETALREADRRKTEFLALLSHELRNPLAPIRNAIALLGRAPPSDPTAARAVEVLDRQTAHLARIVDDLLDLTRITSGKIVLQPRRVELGELVRRACDDLRSLLDRAGVSLRVSTPPAPAWAEADPTRVLQVMGNLLQNAAKFTPPGGRVEVELRAGLAPETGGPAHEVTVRDTGVGVEAEMLPRLFQPFEQAARTRGSSLGGMGLGLALVKSLVTLHGGTVRAASEGAGRGTEIAVSLPAAGPEGVAAPARPPAAEQPQARAGRRSSPLSIVVVEDNADAAETLAELLRLDGHEVRLCATGREGVAAVAELRPDALICDVGLPDLNGHEVARTVCAELGERRPFAIALTGYAQPSDQALALAAGFDAHLPKPPPLEELERLLVKASARRR